MASDAQCGCWQTTALERLEIGFKAMDIPSIEHSAHPGEDSESIHILHFISLLRFQSFIENTLGGPG
jgi:hypothetical protein